MMRPGWTPPPAKKPGKMSAQWCRSGAHSPPEAFFPPAAIGEIHGVRPSFHRRSAIAGTRLCGSLQPRASALGDQIPRAFRQTERDGAFDPRGVPGDAAAPPSPSGLESMQAEKHPSRHDAAIRMAGCLHSFANLRAEKFQFPVNRDTEWRSFDSDAFYRGASLCNRSREEN